VARRGEFERGAFQRGADLEDLARLGRIQPAHPRAAVRPELDPALALELAQRLAQRDAADGEMTRELLLAQRRLRREASVDDGGAQRRGNQLRRALAAGKRVPPAL
jgi:hypothetical protein